MNHFRKLDDAMNMELRVRRILPNSGVWISRHPTEPGWFVNIPQDAWVALSKAHLDALRELDITALGP